MLHVENLDRSFGSLHAVDHVSFHVRPGEIYGLLGPNGAGKTTTISCICGLLQPDSGKITLDGVDAVGEALRARRELAVVPQETALYETLSARENVSFFGSLYGLRGEDLRARTAEVLAQVGLDPSSRQPAKQFSGGMKRRLNLAIGLVSRPRMLLLDEPTVGIDPQARIHILDIVRDVRRNGTAVLYTTHYLEEAESLCDRIGIIDHGRLLAEGTLAELRRMVGEGSLITLRGGFAGEAVRAELDAERRVRVVGLEDGKAVLSVDPASGTASEALAALLQRGLSVTDIAIQEPTLQSLFLKLTGRELRDWTDPDWSCLVWSCLASPGPAWSGPLSSA